MGRLIFINSIDIRIFALEYISMAEAKPSPGPDFVRTIVAADNESGKWNGRVITRFPPEPNGYLHI
ncbi:MAG: hypothetical protein HOC71_18245, partial [Candidatus Latescibacteria bacterium]|nr:hypothetical protein [Candidatus Latescibacterota bacterium]